MGWFSTNVHPDELGFPSLPNFLDLDLLVDFFTDLVAYGIHHHGFTTGKFSLSGTDFPGEVDSNPQPFELIPQMRRMHGLFTYMR